MEVIQIMKPKTDGDSMYIELNYDRFSDIVRQLEYWLDECKAGDSIGFSVEEVSEEELENLPEFEGW